MKKMLSFVLVVVCLSSVFQFKGGISVFDKFENAQKVCFVSMEEYEFAFEKQKCGDLCFNFCEFRDAKENFQNVCNDIEGVEFYLSNVSAKDVLQKLQITQYSKSEVQNMMVYYAYTPLYDDYVWVEGKKVNLQIVEKEGLVVCGFPAVITGY